ncbi:MAG: gamma-glutamyl-gamma-aminobutyrate hydrolase family protein [Gemmatimonadota bacterium]
MSGTRRPLIGVTTQTLQVIDGIPADLPPSWVMNQHYVRALMNAGAAPVLVPLISSDEAALRGVYESLDGILFPGGVDVDPDLYGGDSTGKLDRLDADRDATELSLARWALEEGKPVLGLCRGFQVLNVAAGGTLWPDLAHDRPEMQKHDYFPSQGFTRSHLAHSVDVLRGTRLCDALGARDRVMVNSMHHQGIRELGKQLVPAAVAPDGLVEAFERPGDSFAIGVQWHPEMFASGEPGVGKLFEDFIRATVTPDARA